MSGPKKFAAQLRLGRWSGTSGAGWRLEVSDDASRVSIVDVEITDEQLGKLLGHYDDGSTYPAKLYGAERVGMKHENRTVAVPCSRDDFGDIFDAAERENPGWTADRDERWNSHRYDGTAYRVTLRRWVAP